MKQNYMGKRKKSSNVISNQGRTSEPNWSFGQGRGKENVSVFTVTWRMGKDQSSKNLTLSRKYTLSYFSIRKFSNTWW